ncbi:MAG TPA: hypothetical protein VLD57_12740 [Blastocatellia bacterium]|nr:hypothetical protein [Blastocatellia bacterium]
MSARLLSSILAFMCICVVAAAQQPDQRFVDEESGYRLTLAADWQPVTYTDALGRKRTEFVCRERKEGLLSITRESLNRRSISDLVRKEVEGLELCQAGVTVSGNEVFTGGMLSGRRLAFCYVERGRRVAATYYFLEDRDSVWILRFTGRMGFIDAQRDATDLIARSFCAM